MDRLASGEPRWELVYDEDGNPERFDSEVFFKDLSTSGVEDLFVFSHGWNNDARAARNLYDDMFPRVAEACEGVAGLGRIGFAGVLWPSIWFPETPAFVKPPPGSAEADEEGIARDETSGSDALTGDQIASSVEAGFARESDREAVREIGRLIDRGIASEEGEGELLTQEEQRQLIRDIHSLAQSLAPGEYDVADEDGGEMPLFYGESPLETYPGLSTTFGTTPPDDDTEGVGDWFRKAVEGSKDMVRVLSYTLMKHRAGTVGSKGLGRLLADFPDRAPGVRVHLIGHSFGARLVSFALQAIDEASTSPVHSLLLIQGAFSHFAFSRAAQNAYGAGALHQYPDRVRGPLVATYSKYDYAVGRWYPKASFLSGEDLEGVETVSRWGGMGADGFQDAVHFESFPLEEAGGTFDLQPHHFYRVDAQEVIDNVDQSEFAGAHSDIRKRRVAELAAAAAGAHA
jgi:hypothetical protein